MNTKTPSESKGAPAGPYRKRCRWVSVALMIVIFVSGAVIGSGLTIIFKPQSAIYGHKTLEQRRDIMVERIDGAVNLSDEQKQQVGKIVMERLESIRELRKEIQPQLENQARLLRDKVAGVLHDNQQDKWQQWWKERFEEWFPTPATQPATTTQPARAAPATSRDR